MQMETYYVGLDNFLHSNAMICEYIKCVNKLGQSWAKLSTDLAEIVDRVGIFDQFYLVDLACWKSAS